MTTQRAAVTPPATRFEMPPARGAEPGKDLVAIGADLAPGTLLTAYQRGLFPMPIDPRRRNSKLAWYSPDPRGVLPLDGVRVTRSLRRSLSRYRVEIDTDFASVISACADLRRAGRWITDEFATAYQHLYEMGWAHSVEVYDDADQLVGGLYGVRINGFFAGESMFHRATDASKVALIGLVEWLRSSGATLLDVQWSTPHLSSLGVIELPREEYLRRLALAVG